MGILDGLRSIEELSLEHQRVFVRTDFGAPADDASPDPVKLGQVVPSIEYALKAGARVVLAARVLAGGEAPTLEPFAVELAKLLACDVYLPDDCVGDAARKVVQDLRPGQVCLLENLARHPEEADNDEGFARELCSYADVYINDSLRESRFAHASSNQLPRMLRERAMGLRLKGELSALTRVTEKLERPFVVVAGGADASHAFEFVQTFLERADAVLVGGTLGNTLLAARGQNMKASSVDPSLLARGRGLLNLARDRGTDVVLPSDVMVAAGPHASSAHAYASDALSDGQMALDIGPKTLERFAAWLPRAKTVLWCGPLGAYKNPTFAAQTLEFARLLSEISGFGVVVGDDTLHALSQAQTAVTSRIGFVSTAGRSSLEVLEGRRLAGLEALRSGAT